MSGVVDNLVSKFGTQTALAKLLKCDPSTISQWKVRGGDVIPATWQRKILHVADGMRDVEVTPADFFPAPKPKARKRA